MLTQMASFTAQSKIWPSLLNEPNGSTNGPDELHGPAGRMVAQHENIVACINTDLIAYDK